MEWNVISFNILCADAPNGNSIEARAPRLRSVIAPCSADLIGFQEATPKWMTFLERDYGDAYEIYNVYRGANSLESTPIAWKRDVFQCLEKGHLWFSDTPETESCEWDTLYHCPRIFTWARLKEIASGKEFCFINTHFGFGDECQTKSAQILEAFAAKMACPCVITGDFNMELDSAGYRQMRHSFQDVNAQTVNDTAKTFHGFDPGYQGEHIDYCFATRDVKPIAFRILTDQVQGQYPSDHYGLYARMTL